MKPARHPSVLIVDDNLLNRELVAALLSDAGFQVREARTGEEGIAAAQADPPSLILMDIGLPGIDGFEAVRLLKANQATRHVSVVALTAFAMAGDEERAIAAGFDAYISKPIQTRTFATTVAGVLQREGGRP